MDIVITINEVETKIEEQYRYESHDTEKNTIQIFDEEEKPQFSMKRQNTSSSHIFNFDINKPIYEIKGQYDKDTTKFTDPYNTFGFLL